MDFQLTDKQETLRTQISDFCKQFPDDYWRKTDRERAYPQANMAKLLAYEASWKAANICLDTHGGYGFVDEYDVERKFRETRLFQVAPVNNNLVLAYLANHVLDLPRSYG